MTFNSLLNRYEVKTTRKGHRKPINISLFDTLKDAQRYVEIVSDVHPGYTYKIKEVK